MLFALDLGRRSSPGQRRDPRWRESILPQKRHGTGVTFEAAGQPMDLGRNHVFCSKCYTLL